MRSEYSVYEPSLRLKTPTIRIRAYLLHRAVTYWSVEMRNGI